MQKNSIFPILFFEIFIYCFFCSMKHHFSMPNTNKKIYLSFFSRYLFCNLYFEPINLFVGKRRHFKARRVFSNAGILCTLKFTHELIR